MAVTTDKTNKPILPRGADVRPIDSYNRAELYSGKALDFDGVNDWVNTAYVTGFTGAQEFTYCAYINADTNQETEAIIHGNENTGWGLQSLQLRYETNGMRFFAGTGSPSTSYVDSDPIEANKWYFVVGTHTPTENKIYLNGALNATATAGSLTTAPQAITIGAYPGSSVAFNGEISSPRIFDVALTAEQVADLYNNPEKVVPTGVADSALKLWLPMMEGAGTTAYDGSGNGNHGTISGATYVNGIGAPVAQSAVMDWNKLYDFDGNDLASNGSYVSTSGTKTYKVHFNSHDVTRADQQIFQFWNNTDALGMSGTINFLGTNSGVLGIRGYGSSVSFDNTSWSGLTDNTFYELEFTIDWDAESITSATLNGVASDGTQSARLDTTNNGLYLGARVGTFHLVGIINYFEVVGEDKWTNASGFKSQSGSYDMTISGSPTQILAPQGLTTGRDITGVNLFENVRKQGALNLDGKSWAEVHDNESLDMTDAISAECWVYWRQTTASNDSGLLSRWDGATGRQFLIYHNTTTSVQFYIDNANSQYQSMTEGWHHIVGTYDKVNRKIYVDGVLRDTDAQTTSIPSSDDKIEIGRYSHTASKNTEDTIAQPRIYNRALTASEALNNYNVTKDLYI